jgi:hypothetical protein
VSRQRFEPDISVEKDGRRVVASDGSYSVVTETCLMQIRFKNTFLLFLSYMWHAVISCFVWVQPVAQRECRQLRVYTITGTTFLSSHYPHLVCLHKKSCCIQRWATTGPLVAHKVLASASFSCVQFWPSYSETYSTKHLLDSDASKSQASLASCYHSTPLSAHALLHESDRTHGLGCVETRFGKGQVSKGYAVILTQNTNCNR